MSVADAATAAMGGMFDVFDRAAGVANHIEKLIDFEDIPCELHGVPTAEGELFKSMPALHLFDQAAEMKERLNLARQFIRNAESICQQVLAEIP